MPDLLNRDEAMAYARVSRSTIDRACQEWRRTKGCSGLRYVQRAAGTHRKFRQADLDRWLTGETNTRRLRAAS